MNIAVTGNIAVGKSTLFRAIADFIAIHGAWKSVLREYIGRIPDRPFMLRACLSGRITKDFFE